MRPTFSLSPKAPDNVQIDINGMPLAAASNWGSELITFGDHTVPLTLTARNGLSSHYELSVSRGGAQVGSVQPAVSDDYDAFGFSLAISGDTIVVGATGEDGAIGGVNGDESSNNALESGAAYVFVREGGKWSKQAYLKADQPTIGDYFGTSVALDGDTLVVGAVRAGDHSTSAVQAGVPQRNGLVFVFERKDGKWAQRAKITSPRNDVDWFGYSVAFTADSILIGAPHDAEDGENAGAVYVMPRDGTYTKLTKLASPGWAAKQAPQPTVALAPLDVRFGPSRILQPDLMVFLRPLPRDIETPITRVPELVIEVLSNNRAYDRFTKRALYAEAGVKEYWLVDIDGSRIEVRTGAALSGERFCTDKLSSLLLPDFVLDVSALIG